MTDLVLLRQKKIAKLVKGKVLDVGYADHPNPLLPQGTVGFDLIKRKTPSNYSKKVIGDALSVDKFFPKKSFDTIVAAEIVEHMENPAQFLRAARKLLKDDGTLILSTPNPYHPPTILVNVLMLRPMFTAHATHDPWHINLFPYRNMITLLEHCDLKLEKTVNANGLLYRIDRGIVIPFFKSLSQDLIYVVKKADWKRTPRK